MKKYEYIRCKDLVNLMSKYMEDEEIYETLDIEEEDDSVYMVSWPEHVLNRRYNSDANYQLTNVDDDRVWKPSRNFWTNY